MPPDSSVTAAGAAAAAAPAAPVAPASLRRHARPGVFTQSARIAWKDLRVELRSREIVYTMAFFAGLLVIVYSFTFPADPSTVKAAAPGMLWVALAFAGTIGLGRAFDREREHDTLRALMLAPIPRLAIFLGKAMAIAVLVIAVAVVAAPLMALFLNAPLFAYPGELALILALGALGFAVIGSVFAATLLKVRSRDVLLPVVLYPLLIPLFVAGTSTTSQLLKDVPDFGIVHYWTAFLGIYDGAFLVLSLWIFESLVIE